MAAPVHSPPAPVRTDPVGDLLAFIAASPSPFHACLEAGRRLEAAGFARQADADAWPAGGRHFLVRGGTLVAWAVPDGARATTPFRIAAAHTDSPNLRVRPHADTTRAGWRQLAVEVYGSPLLNSWLDRDLGLSGRVALRGGSRLLRVDRPLLRIPQLAIHLDREISTNGLKLNPQQHLAPVWGVGDLDIGAFPHFLAAELDLSERDILGWDVMVHDVAPPSRLGPAGELISAPRLDNLCSAWAAVTALVEAAGGAEATTVGVASLFDHEEVGSVSASGAAGPILTTALERLVLARGGDREDFHRALARSVCVSSDMAHATHPNYSDRHEPGHWIRVNGGPVIKTNVNQRYATDGAGAALFTAACERAGVPVQHYSHRADMPCGSTIGPDTAARLGITTVDVGAPQLAMHSARELMGADDPAYLARALAAFLAGPAETGQ